MSPVAAYIVETLVTLAGIIALAVAVLYGGRRLGIGRPSGPLELVGRLPLDARRAVYLVRVGKLVYVVGASEGGLTRLGEIDAGAVPPVNEGTPPSRFSEILAKMSRPGQSVTSRGESSPHVPPSSLPTDPPKASPGSDPAGHA